MVTGNRARNLATGPREAVTTRWIVHCIVCGYLTRPEYPAQWDPDPCSAYRFHHKREALGLLTEYSRMTRQLMAVEPVETEIDAIFD